MSVATTSAAPVEYRPGSLVTARGREWVVLPDDGGPDLLRLRPLGGAEEDATRILLSLEAVPPRPATFPPPNPDKTGAQAAALLLRDALRLKLRSGAGPFRCFGNIAVEPRAYQLPRKPRNKTSTADFQIGTHVDFHLCGNLHIQISG